MVRKSRRFPKVLTEDDLKKIVRYMMEAHWYQNNITGDFHKWRDITASCIMFYTGLRPGEALGLKWSDIDFENRLIRINPMNNKEKNDLPAVLSNPAINSLRKYQEVLRKMGIVQEYLFPSMWTWKPLTTDAYAKRFQRIVREAGLSEFKFYDEGGMPHYSASPYIMRTSFITNVYKKTHDPYAASKCARHLKYESIQPYVHLDTDETRSIIDFTFDTNIKENNRLSFS